MSLTSAAKLLPSFDLPPLSKFYFFQQSFFFSSSARFAKYMQIYTVRHTLNTLGEGVK